MKRRGILLFVILAVAVFAGLAFYGDFPELIDQIADFPVRFWLAALGLAAANYVLRLVRWHYYMHVLKIPVGLVSSGLIFVAGLSMAISPGRVGELAKSYFLRERAGVPVSRSSAAVVAERVMDLVGVLLLSVWGLFLVPYGWAAAILVIAGVAAFFLLCVSSWGSAKVLALPLPARWKPFLTNARDSIRQLSGPRELAVVLPLSVVAWFMEGLAMWVVLQGLGAPGSLGEAVSIYAAATLLGAISLLPGGLVGTEGGMIALLGRLDMSRTTASSATFIVRVCTLWFAIALGVLALVYLQFQPSNKERESGDTERVETEAQGPRRLGAGSMAEQERPADSHRPGAFGVVKAAVMSTRPVQWTKAIVVFLPLAFSLDERWTLDEGGLFVDLFLNTSGRRSHIRRLGGCGLHY